MAKAKKSRGLNVYSNLSRRRKGKKEADLRKHAEYLATLPKNPIKRFFYRLHPKRVWAYWFSKRGAIMALKITGIALLVICLFVGALFAYFRKDLDAINPDELSKRVQTTVTKYLDRNGNVLWEDTGSGNYKLVVPSDDLSPYLKQATVAIEDKDFYKHGAISVSGTVRAALTDIKGGQVEGGSTLTQQLVKQVFFASEAQDRGITGIPRKIKEAILAFEVERTYDKDQILTMYLNESPYGGPRNGAESAAETYFGVPAKNLTLAQATLLAAIPQDPTYFNPYNTDGNADLIARQHTVLNDMVTDKYITKAQADAAKAEPILDSLKPESDQYSNMQAPWFVTMVRQQLIQQLGASVVGDGGLTVTTTLDIRIQNALQSAMNTMFSSYIPAYAGFSDAASTVEDVKTGQILAMMGSPNWNTPGFGETNAATAYIQPGSTIKPLVYAQLFQPKPAGQQNYGSGSHFNDSPSAAVNALYGAPLHDDDNIPKGPITVRDALAQSRNIPAVEAMAVNGVKPTINEIHAMGGTSYCTQGNDTEVGLSAAIGGCGIEQIDLVNAYASLARGGAYIPQSSIIKVTNSSGEVLQKWSQPKSKQVVDPQSAYIVSDILHDDVARTPLDGAHAKGMYIPGVPTATKTGTSDIGGQAKDIWMASYSPAIAMAVWFGNPDTTILKNGTSALPGPVIASVMTYAHEDVYQQEGLWKSNEWFTQPAGIQKIGSELYPSWYNAKQGQTNATLTFDRASKKLATTCTPAAAQDVESVVKSTDPVTKQTIYSAAPAGYDAADSDTSHGTPPNCLTPSPGNVTIVQSGTSAQITLSGFSYPSGFSVTGVTASINGTVYTATGSGDNWTINNMPTGASSATVTVDDSGYYDLSGSYTISSH